MSENFTVQSRFRTYEVRFTPDAAKDLEAYLDGNHFFIADSNVLNLDPRLSILPQDRLLAIEATEDHKTLEYCHDLVKQLIPKGVRKNSRLVAIGGGIIQDITGFIASILYRGIEWSFCPTTLLAQADSCIGSKTSINIGSYKNLLGNFYPPMGIYLDTGFLKTLRIEDIKSGIGEMLHFYLIAASGKAEEVVEQYENLLTNRGLLKDFILESLRIKKATIEIDEMDKGVRNLFNYGHTFGHALESVTDYAIPHGQAVTMGMDIANMISRELGYLDSKEFDRLQMILEKNRPDFQMAETQMDFYMAALSRDKKNISRDLTCILTKGAGRMFKTAIPLDENLRNLIVGYFQALRQNK